MARELLHYRENIEILNNRFPEHDMLTEEQAMEVTGYKTRSTLRKYLGRYFTGRRISKAAMARWMCGV